MDGVRQPDEDGRKNPWMTLKQQTRPPWHNSSPPSPPLLSSEPAGNNPDMTNCSITTNALQL